MQKQDETQTVVRSGLTPPERVVTTGFARLTEGAKVTIGDGATPATPPAGTRPRNGERPAAVGQSQRRRGGGGTSNPTR